MLNATADGSKSIFCHPQWFPDPPFWQAPLESQKLSALVLLGVSKPATAITCCAKQSEGLCLSAQDAIYSGRRKGAMVCLFSPRFLLIYFADEYPCGGREGG